MHPASVAMLLRLLYDGNFDADLALKDMLNQQVMALSLKMRD